MRKPRAHERRKTSLLQKVSTRQGNTGIPWVQEETSRLYKIESGYISKLKKVSWSVTALLSFLTRGNRKKYCSQSFFLSTQAGKRAI